jgi:hypothetical protein
MVAPGGFSGTYTSFVKLLRVNNLVQGRDERFDLTISLHAAEAAFGVQQSGHAPPLTHVAVPPTLDATRHVFGSVRHEPVDRSFV